MSKSVMFRWIPENPEPWYSEQMGVWLHVNRHHANWDDAVRKWAFRAARKYDRVPSSYGTFQIGDWVCFKGDLSHV